MFTHVCLIISRILFFIYIVIVYAKYRPSCISESYYKLKHKNIFSIWLITISFLILPQWLEITPDNFQFVSFLSVISLIVVALSPRYLENDRKLHIIAACATAILSLLWTFVTGFYQPLIIFIIILIMLYLLKAKNLLFWIEISAFLNIYISINPAF